MWRKIYVSTGHATKNYRVFHEDGKVYCESFGVLVGRYRKEDGFIELSKEWDKNHRSIKHIQWFLKEKRRWHVDLSEEKLYQYTEGRGCYLPVVDFLDDVYRVTS